MDILARTAFDKSPLVKTANSDVLISVARTASGIERSSIFFTSTNSVSNFSTLFPLNNPLFDNVGLKSAGISFNLILKLSLSIL